MATQAYYRKWRSQTFGELVGQEHVTRTLRNAVRTGRVAHAYVFSGPRGVGKTSAARLLAKAVNCEASVDGEPCNQCSSCRSIAEGRALDVIEIDAASNNGVEQIRDLSEKVNFLPTESRYKFYILDEAHMLTGSAANAFLKTLEEPPAHTVFVLATTEAYRLPATILSRCQRLEFRRIAAPAMLERLQAICRGEGIDAEPAALELIARGSTGSLRDAEGLLDQLVAYAGPKIGVEQVRAIVGLGGSEAAAQLVEHLADGDTAAGLRLINEVVDAGADPRHFTREVVDFLRGVMLVKAGEGLAELLDAAPDIVARMTGVAKRLSAAQVLQCVRVFTQGEPPARGLTLGQLPLEMAFVEAGLLLSGGLADQAASPAGPGATSRRVPERGATPGTPPVVPPRPSDSPEPRPAPPSVAPAGPPRETARGEVAPVADASPVPRPAPTEPAAPPRTRRPADARRGRTGGEGSLTMAEVLAKWPEAVQRVGADSRTKSIQALLRDARPVRLEGGGTIVLGCRFPFHRDRLNEDKTRLVVENVLSQVLGQRCRTQMIVDDGEEPVEVAPPPDPFQSVMDDPVVKGAVSLGWRVRRILKHEEVVYDAESEDDAAAPGQAGQDAGGAR